MAVDTTNAFNFNRYAYANNSPHKFTDPDGRYVEAVVEVASLAVGATSFVNNVSSGRYLAASADAVGMAIDGVALAVPVVPGVAGLGIQASRAADELTTAANSVPDLIYRTGSQSDNALTDASGVSFRDSISSAADGAQTFKPGDKIFAVDTSKLPQGSVVVDGGVNGVPAGHVSVNATPDQIRAAVTQDVGGTALEGLKKLDDGSFRMPK